MGVLSQIAYISWEVKTAYEITTGNLDLPKNAEIFSQQPWTKKTNPWGNPSNSTVASSSNVQNLVSESQMILFKLAAKIIHSKKSDSISFSYTNTETGGVNAH